jgi:DNA-binding MarR family transcriptional regulator
MEDYIKLLDTLIKSTNKMFSIMEDILFQSNIRDISTAQLFLLFKIESHQLYKVGELQNTYNNNINISYNLKSLEKNKYIIKTNNKDDFRQTLISLSDKGQEIKILFADHLKSTIQFKDIADVTKLMKVINDGNNKYN